MLKCYLTEDEEAMVDVGAQAVSLAPAPPPLHPHERPSYLAFTFERAFGFPFMGQAVKTHLPYTLSDVVLTASVRCFRRPGGLFAEWG